MKRFVLLLSIGLLTGALYSQTPERRWGVGVHGGLTQYNGDLGWGFYRLDQAAYGHLGLSVSRYLSRHLDVFAMATIGELGHLERNVPPDYSLRTHFLIDIRTANLFLRYNFGKPDAIVRPFIHAGGGVIRQTGLSGEYPARRYLDVAAPSAGAGIKFRVAKFMSVQLMETFMYTNADDMDLTVIGANDMYLYHTLGLVFNIGKRRTGMDGVGDRIDKCPENYLNIQNGKENSNKDINNKKKRKKHRS